MTSSDASKQNRSNVKTLRDATCEPCTHLLREFFKSKIPQEQFLSKFKIKKPLLRTPELKNMVKKSEKLFDGTYEKFDLSLLYFHLRNVTKIPPPLKGWDKDLDKSDTSNSACIERIKQIRNVSCHTTEGQLSDEEFQEYWKDLEQSVRFLELSLPGEYNPKYSSALALIKKGHQDCKTQQLSKKEKLEDNDTEEYDNEREMHKADSQLNSPEYGTFPGLITRKKWNAKSPKTNASKFLRDPYIVVIIHGVTNLCFTHAECIKSVQAYQDFHMDTKGWDDIGYNFLIGEDGNVYEGRGPDSIGAHTLGHNAYSIGICFIGNYNFSLPNPKALEASKRLIKWLVETKKIPENYILKGHRDLRPTESPGEILYQEIQNWPHYAK